MTGWLIVLAVAAFIGAVIWWWHWLDRKHMRDSIREADAFMLKHMGPPPVGSRHYERYQRAKERRS